MTPLSEVSRSLPWWSSWGPPLVAILFSAALAYGWTRFVSSRAFRDAGDLSALHWTERARRVFAIRASVRRAAIASLVSPILFLSEVDNPLDADRFGLVATLCFATAVVAAAVPTYRSACRIAGVSLGVRTWLLGQIAMALIYLPGLVAVLLATAFAPDRFGVNFEAWAAGSFVVVLYAPYIGLSLAELFGLMRPGSERSQEIVGAASGRTGIAVRRVFEMQGLSANAFAVPTSQAVIFTEGALRSLSDAELEAVAAHELGHLAEPRRIKSLRFLGGVAWYPLVALQPLLRESGALAAGLLCAFVFLASYGSLRLLRRLEGDADRIAADDRGADYASALERLYEANLTPAVLRVRTTHPDLYDRLIAMGHPPPYPRPPPPARPPLLGFAAFGMTLVFVVAHRVAHHQASRDPDVSETARVALIAFGGEARDIRSLGLLYAGKGRLDEAALLLQAADEVTRRSGGSRQDATRATASDR